MRNQPTSVLKIFPPPALGLDFIQDRTVLYAYCTISVQCTVLQCTLYCTVYTINSRNILDSRNMSDVNSWHAESSQLDKVQGAGRPTQDTATVRNQRPFFTYIMEPVDSSESNSSSMQTARSGGTHSPEDIMAEIASVKTELSRLAKVMSAAENARKLREERIFNEVQLLRGAMSAHQGIKADARASLPRQVAKVSSKVWLETVRPADEVDAFDRATVAIKIAAGNLKETADSPPRCSGNTPTGTTPWAAEALWAKKGTMPNVQSQVAQLLIFEERERVTTRFLIIRALRRLGLLYCKASEYYSIMTLCNSGAQTSAGGEGATRAEDAPWVRFLAANEKDFCEQVLVYQQQKHGGSTEGFDPVSDLQRLINLLGDLLQYMQAALVDNKTKLFDRFKSLASHPGGPARPVSDDFALERLQTAIGRLMYAFRNVAQAAVLPPVAGTLKRKKPSGRPDHFPDPRHASGDDLQALNRHLDLLKTICTSLKSAVRTKSSVCRKNLRTAIWRRIGYALYATIRGRRGWTITLLPPPAGDDSSTTRTCGTVSDGGSQSCAAGASESTLPYFIPDAITAVLHKELEPELSFRRRKDKSGRRRKDNSGSSSLCNTAEMDEQNKASFAKLKQAFPSLTVKVRHPVMVKPAELESEEDFEDAKERVSPYIGNITAREDIYVSREFHVSMHDLALRMLMDWAGHPSGSTAAEIHHEQQFLSVSKSSLRAVHSVAQSLAAAVQFGLQKGRLDRLSDQQQSFLGQLRPFQVTKATMQGGVGECQTLTPGLVTVRREPWDDKGLVLPENASVEQTYATEDSYFLHDTEHLRRSTRESTGKHGEATNDCIAREVYVSLDEFCTLLAEDASAGGAAGTVPIVTTGGDGAEQATTVGAGDGNEPTTHCFNAAIAAIEAEMDMDF